MAAVLAGPVIPVTVPNELRLKTVPSIILPITKTTPVITVHIITNINPDVLEFMNMNKVVGIRVRHIMSRAIRLVVNLSVKNPHPGTEIPANKFPVVRAAAAVT